jgi:hypothetical protein
MDDLISGADTLEEAESIKVQVSSILSSAGFELRKWASSSIDLMKNIPSEFQETLKKIGETDILKTLGVGSF